MPSWSNPCTDYYADWYSSPAVEEAFEEIRRRRIEAEATRREWAVQRHLDVLADYVGTYRRSAQMTVEDFHAAMYHDVPERPKRKK